MIKFSSIKFSAGVLISFLCIPSLVFGLAGWSELSYEYYYSPNILIEFSVPSDACSPEYNKNQRCIKIYSADDGNKFKKFKNLDSLTEVNLPLSSSPKFIIGKSYFDDSWLIYDIQKDEKLFVDKNFDLVKKEYEKLGVKTPTLVSMNNFDEYFKNETSQSLEAREGLEDFAKDLFLGMGAIIVFIITTATIISFIIRMISRKI